jgi:hypothetical protein
MAPDNSSRTTDSILRIIDASFPVIGKGIVQKYDQSSCTRHVDAK